MQEFKLELGINDECTNNEYHGDREYVSSSVLKKILFDPQEYYRNYVLGMGKETSKAQQNAFDFGTYIHALLLEPHTIEHDFAFFQGLRRKGKAWDEFKEEHKDRIIVTPSQRDMGERMEKNFNADLLSTSIARDPSAVFEETVCAEINGVKVKVRTDCRRGTDIGDVKTTAEPLSTDNWLQLCSKVCMQWDYDLSAALYCDVLEAVTGKKHYFHFFFISKVDAVCRYVKASQQFIENGRRKYLDAIEVLKEANKKDNWNEIIVNSKKKELIVPESHIYRRK